MLCLALLSVNNIAFWCHSNSRAIGNVAFRSLCGNKQNGIYLWCFYLPIGVPANFSSVIRPPLTQYGKQEIPIKASIRFECRFQSTTVFFFYFFESSGRGRQSSALVTGSKSSIGINCVVIFSTPMIVAPLRCVTSRHGASAKSINMWLRSVRRVPGVLSPFIVAISEPRDVKL